MILCVLALLLAPEAAIFLAANHAFIAAARGHCRVIVLGFPARSDGTPGLVQRYRMSVAFKAQGDYACGPMILTGGKPSAGRSEAEVMAQLAYEHGIAPDALILEKKAANTWENIAFSLPYVKDDEHILIASDPLHAQRARLYLCRQRPEACSRAHAVAGFRPLDLFFYQWGSAIWTLKALAADRLRRGGR